ncbi:uncharacterized protein RJT21DRAFT_12557 [Scheffersomyces amazonensis]|uniref:uncharacterized protein n=1 Tax=Scheffersomyces amazonensis TaxID=1078765 RepID=UPI00315CB3E5
MSLTNMTNTESKVRRSSRHGKNVYVSSSGELVKQRTFDKRAISNSPHHSIIDTGAGLEIELNKDAKDYEDMVVRKGFAVPPDEVLGSGILGGIKVPIKHRDEFTDKRGLPSSDLLEVLHYFTSKKLTSHDKSAKAIRRMDETALLSLGLLVESWIDEMIDEGTAKLFVDYSPQEEKAMKGMNNGIPSDLLSSISFQYESEEDEKGNTSSEESSSNSD